jgi:beta-lactamase regulating signal transducer with metallopeptidase domain
MNPLSGAPWLLLLGEYAVKSTVILALALAAVHLAGRKTASFRHIVLSLALVSLLTLPVLSLVPYGWETSVLPGGPTASTLAEDPGPAVLSDPGIAIAPVEESVVSGISGVTEQAGERAGFGRRFIPAAWAAGAIFILLRLAAGLLGARRLTREGETVADPIWRVLIQRFLAAVGLRRTVRLKSHREVAVPLTWGLLRPVILIPSDHGQWSDDQRSSALFHELSHIKRADFLMMLLVRLSLAAFWFNPLSWIVLARIRKEQEKACDDLVLRVGLKPSTYAANLLHFKRTAGFRWDPSAALLGLFGGSSFNERLSAILRQRLAFKEVTMRTKLILALAIVLTVALIGCARPASSAVQAAPPAGVAVAAAPASPAQEAKAVAREKQAEKPAQQKAEEKKAEDKKAEEKKAEKKPIEIVIVQGDTSKTLRLSEGLILREGPEGKFIVLSPGDKEIELLKGEPFRIEIKGDKLGQNYQKIAIQIDEEKLKELKEKAKALAEDKKKLADEIRKSIVIKGNADKLRKEIREKIAVQIDEERLKELTEKAKALAETRAKEKSATIVLESGKLKDEIKKATALALAAAKDAKGQAVIVRESEAALREQVKKIQEMLSEVKEKKRDLADLEKAVEKLEAELADREKSGEVEYRIALPGKVWTVTEPEVVTVIREKEGKAGTQVVMRPRVGVEIGANAITIKTTEGEGGGAVVVVSAKGKSREDYERAVTQVKKDLPGGATLDPKFDEESGIITLTVKFPEKTDVPKDLIDKFASALKNATKK